MGSVKFQKLLDGGVGLSSKVGNSNLFIRLSDEDSKKFKNGDPDIESVLADKYLNKSKKQINMKKSIEQEFENIDRPLELKKSVNKVEVKKSVENDIPTKETDIKKAIENHFENIDRPLSISIEKGKRAVLGEIREYFDGKYEKTATGWKYIKGSDPRMKGKAKPEEGKKEDKDAEILDEETIKNVSKNTGISVDEFKKLNSGTRKELLSNYKSSGEKTDVEVDKLKKEIQSIKDYIKNGKPHNNDYTAVMNDLREKEAKLSRLSTQTESKKEEPKTEATKEEKKRGSDEIRKEITEAPIGSEAEGGGYSKWVKIDTNSWKNPETGSLSHNEGIFERIGTFSDFKVKQGKAGKKEEVKEYKESKTLDNITKAKIQKRVESIVIENADENGEVKFSIVSKKIIDEFGEEAIEEAKKQYDFMFNW